MEEEKKICIKCTKEFPKTEIYFRKSRVNTDGFEGQCKKCRKKYFADYRKSKRVRSKPVKLTMDVKVKKKIPKLQPDPIKPIIKATPTEIMIALRKGFVLEVIEIIRKEFEL